MDKMLLISEKELEKKIILIDKEYASLSWISRSGDRGIELEKKYKTLIESLFISKEVEVVDMNAEHIKYICKDKPDMFEYIKTNGYQLIKTK